MGESPSHKFGQIIGDILEGAVEPLLRQFAAVNGLYLDKQGDRPARSSRKVSWTDIFRNVHDLDYVLERGGTSHQIGSPVAFIEIAWRRYTKHSRNKVQEIQGAVLPLATTYERLAPFCGAILAGDFTTGALQQLRSRGFSVLYFPYESVIEAFAAIGLDANYNESTPDADFKQKVEFWQNLPATQQLTVARRLIDSNLAAVAQFLQALEAAVNRRIELVRILPLHGTITDYNSVEEAICFIATYDESNGTRPIIKYEVEVRFTNGDNIRGQFSSRESAIQFLNTFVYSDNN